MTVHWGSLLAVFLVSLGSSVAVVALVATALWGLSARAPAVDATAASPRLSRGGGAAVAAASLTAAALVVLFGFWVIIGR